MLYDLPIGFLHEDEPPLTDPDRVSLQYLTQEALASGQVDSAVRAGLKAPRFALADVSGVIHDSLALLRKGPLIVMFVRGLWCGYSYARLRSLDQVAEQIKCRGASVVIISPQLVFSDRDRARKETLGFPILCDSHSSVAMNYGIGYRLPSPLTSLYKSLGVCLKTLNQSNVDTLPHAALFVIDKQGGIVLSEMNTNYTEATAVDELLLALECICAARPLRPCP